MKKRTNKIDIIIAIFISVLTIMMPVSFTALQPEVKSNGEVKQNSVINTFSFIISKTISFFDIVPSVAAIDVGCCEKTKTGAKCQITQQNECQSGWHNGQTCENICRIGCCIDSQGICNKQSTSVDCVLPARFIPNDALCTQDVSCKKGCCSIGYQRRWETNKTCVETYHGSWDGSIPDYGTCIAQSYTGQYGCCKSVSGGCQYITQGECQGKAGTFFTGQKCNQNVPGCEACNGNGAPKCIEGLNDLYRTDNCGNIYSDEPVQPTCSSQKKFCNPSTNTCQSGECTNVYDNYKAQGDFSNLPGRHGQTRQNGESWCVYDRPDIIVIAGGLGTEPAGSRHWRHYCLNGKEYVDACADYRQQFCSETLIDVQSGNIVADNDGPISYNQRYNNNNYRSMASCVGNNWKSCLLTQDETQCRNNPTCFWVTDLDTPHTWSKPEKGIGNWAGIKSDSLEKVSTPIGQASAPARCLPRVPPGLDDSQNGFQNREAICKLGDVNCTVEDRLFGDSNPECDDSGWAIGMARRCRAIADCGAYINYLHGTDGKNTFTSEGLIIAEINPDKDDSGNIIGKKIERTVGIVLGDVFGAGSESGSSGTAWGKLGAVFGGMVMLIAAGVSTYIVIKMINNGQIYSLVYSEYATGGKILPFHWSNLFKLGTKWGTKEGMQDGWKAVFTNPAFIAGAVLLVIAHYFMPDGPGKALVQSTGVGLAAGGISTGLGLGTVALPIGIISGIIWALFKATWDVDHMIVACMPYVPPTGGADCEKCNQDPERPCSKYRCQSLGTACLYKGEDANGQPCEQSEGCGFCYAEANEGTAPLITKVTVTNPVNYVANPSQPGLPPTTIFISKADGGQIDPWTTLDIKVDLNKRAVCKFDKISRTIDTMEMPFGSTIYRQSQTTTIGLGRYLGGNNVINLYVRCKDVYGNANFADYILTFTVSTTDLTPPQIIDTDPLNGAKFGAGIDKLNLTIYVNEPSNCSWSKTDKTYAEMVLENGQCIARPIISGFACNTTLTGIVPETDNIFYLRCNDAQGNTMQESYQLTLTGTKALQISSLKPEKGSTIAGCTLAPRALVEVETIEGANDGNATCLWSNVSYEQGMTQFTQTNSNSHATNVSVSSGLNNIYVECYDNALNKARNMTTFSVIADSTPPRIVRMYKDGGSLALRTSEDATCAFNYFFGKKVNDCSFVANDTMHAKKFTSSGTEHTTEWDNLPWYVKCYDVCGNGGLKTDPCTVIYPQDVEQ